MDEFIHSYGYIAVLIGTIIEGETVLVAAGIAAYLGHLQFPLVVIFAFAGSVLGDCSFFLLGHYNSSAILDRFPSWRKRVRRSRRFMNRHLPVIMLSFRFLYGLRTVIPFSLGMGKVNVLTFILLDLICSFLWAIGITALGYFLGTTLDSLLGNIRNMEMAVLGSVILAGFIGWGIYILRTRKKE